MPEAVCTYFGAKHQMVITGGAFITDENQNSLRSLFPEPYAYKCKCGETFITEGNPAGNAQIGNYVTHGGIVGMAVVAGVVMTKVKKSLIRSTTATTLPGIVFLYAPR